MWFRRRKRAEGHHPDYAKIARLEAELGVVPPEDSAEQVKPWPTITTATTFHVKMEDVVVVQDANGNMLDVVQGSDIDKLFAPPPPPVPLKKKFDANPQPAPQGVSPAEFMKANQIGPAEPPPGTEPNPEVIRGLAWLFAPGAGMH